MESERHKQKEAEKIADLKYGRVTKYSCPEDYTDKSLAIFAVEIDEEMDRKLSNPSKQLIEKMKAEVNRKVEDKVLSYVLEVKKLKRQMAWIIAFFAVTFVYIILGGIK